MTVKFSTIIDSETKKTIEELRKKTDLPIHSLTEKAFHLLKEYYERLSKVYSSEVVNQAFVDMVSKVDRKYGKTLKRLAK